MEKFNIFVLCLLAIVKTVLLQDSNNNIAETGVSETSDYLEYFRESIEWNKRLQSHFANAATFFDLAAQSLLHIEDRKCYPRFGCFSIVGPWINEQTRPVSLFPLPPEVVDPQFCLYTRRNPFDCEKLIIDDPSSIYRSSYVTRGQVYFIAHGFVEHGNRPWIKEMTAELLKRSSANVIVIDWAGGSNPPYTQAVANIRLVGVMTAHLINMMVKEVVGLKAEKVHLIGHSLGAHLASYIGTSLRKTFGMRIGRISGLDPAEPHFADTDNIVRLDPTDAIFVDNIHTDAIGFIRMGLGMRAPIGHVDFYPNGGKDQPGCTDGIQGSMTREKGSFINGVRRWLNCDHIKSYQYFTETINKKLPTLAAECGSYESYLNGSCFTCENDHFGLPKCAPMGFHSINVFSPLSSKKRSHNVDVMLSDSPKKRYSTMYLITGESAPFYKSQYRVTIKVSEETRESGSFEINLLGNNKETGFLPLDYRLKYFEDGSVHSTVVAGPDVGPVESAILRWSHHTSFINPLTWRFAIPFVLVDLVTVDTLGQSPSLRVCPPTKLQSGSSVSLGSCQ